jgi:hypothetical protein
LILLAFLCPYPSSWEGWANFVYSSFRQIRAQSLGFELDRTLSGRWNRAKRWNNWIAWNDLVCSRRRNAKIDLDIVREVFKVTKEVPIERAYDLSFAKEAGWKPWKT